MEVILDYLDAAVLDSFYDSARERVRFEVCPLLRHQAASFWSAKGARHLADVCFQTTHSDCWTRNSVLRQGISLFLLVWGMSTFCYFFFGTVCYYRNFDRSLKSSPKFHPTQIRREMTDSLLALFWGSILTAPIFVAQLQGKSRIYRFGSASWWYEVAQYPFFLLFSDTCMYWLHRMFHAPPLFRMLHSKHHRYVIPTPFSAYAFNPLEAWIMSLPIYAYSFIWPMSDMAQLAVFCCTNVWTFLLHDNRNQFHTVHHKNINFNFGQYLHLWDRLGGTYRDAETFLNPGIKTKG